MRTHSVLGGTRNARSDQFNALLATLMHYIRENASTESATYCLRYMPKDPRLRSTGRPDPRGIPLSRSSTTITACSNSTSRSSSKSTSTTTTIANVRFRRAVLCASGKKNIRSNIRPIVGDATSVKVRLFRSTPIAKQRNDQQRSNSDTLTCLSEQLLNGV